jgi:hypothetical protein
MIYGTTTFYVEKGSVTITKSQTKKVMHYIATDSSTVYSLGRSATIITCVIITRSDAERIAIEQLLHSETKATLEYHNFYYKDVIPGETHEATPLSPSKDTWAIQAEFIALDPVPYSKSTNLELY